jgi:hypothetical protein
MEALAVAAMVRRALAASAVQGHLVLVVLVEAAE